MALSQHSTGKAAIPRKRIISLVLLLFITAAAIAVLWKLLAFMPSLSVPVLFKGIGKSIEDARIGGLVERYIGAVLQGDEPRALSMWILPNVAPQGVLLDQLAERRIATTRSLIAARPTSSYEIKSIELWHPACCESGPGLTGDYNWAAGARIQVDLAIGGAWESYFFDLFENGRIVEPGKWVIRDIYRLNQEPLYWRIRSKLQNDAFP
jgi:hypothetical protein